MVIPYVSRFSFSGFLLAKDQFSVRNNFIVLLNAIYTHEATNPSNSLLSQIYVKIQFLHTIIVNCIMCVVEMRVV